MGELFRQVEPETSLAWTGERMVTSEFAAIEAEHYHRYFLARELCRGKDVLDVASGEGYGSAFLAQTAKSVVGVEIDPGSVEHASREYRAANLHYTVGDAAKLPLEDNSVDVVVSFETIEHISEQAAFLTEVKRVLRPSGFFMVSTPDVDVYSALGTEANPYHVREMTDTEFRGILGRAFRHVSVIRQRAVTGSVILADEVAAKAGNPWVFEQRDARAYEADRRLLRAPFLLAIASDGAVPQLNVSLYIQTADTRNDAAEVRVELQRLRDLEDRVREQEPAMAKAISDAATVPHLRAELDHIRREHAATVASLSLDAASARVEADGYKRVNDALEGDLQTLRSDFAALKKDLESEREQTTSLQSRLDLSASLARQQSLTVQRNLLELRSAKQESEALKREIEACKQELERQAENQKLEVAEFNRQLDDYKKWLESYKTAYAQATRLIIPLRVRSALPAPLKAPFRAAKRALRSMLHRSP